MHNITYTSEKAILEGQNPSLGQALFLSLVNWVPCISLLCWMPQTCSKAMWWQCSDSLGLKAGGWTCPLPTGWSKEPSWLPLAPYWPEHSNCCHLQRRLCWRWGDRWGLWLGSLFPSPTGKGGLRQKVDWEGGDRSLGGDTRDIHWQCLGWLQNGRTTSWVLAQVMLPYAGTQDAKGQYFLSGDFRSTRLQHLHRAPNMQLRHCRHAPRARSTGHTPQLTHGQHSTCSPALWPGLAVCTLFNIPEPCNHGGKPKRSLNPFPVTVLGILVLIMGSCAALVLPKGPKPLACSELARITLMVWGLFFFFLFLLFLDSVLPGKAGLGTWGTE